MDKKEFNDLFSTKENSEKLYGELLKTAALFKEEKVGRAFADLLVAILEAEHKLCEFANFATLRYPHAMERMDFDTMMMLISSCHNSLTAARCDLDAFGWVVSTSPKGKKLLKRIDDAVAKAKNYKELNQLFLEAFETK